MRSLLSRHNALSSPNERREWRGGVGDGWGFRELRSLGECGAAPTPDPSPPLRGGRGAHRRCVLQNISKYSRCSQSDTSVWKRSISAFLMWT